MLTYVACRNLFLNLGPYLFKQRDVHCFFNSAVTTILLCVSKYFPFSQAWLLSRHVLSFLSIAYAVYFFIWHFCWTSLKCLRQFNLDFLEIADALKLKSLVIHFIIASSLVNSWQMIMSLFILFNMYCVIQLFHFSDFILELN